MITTWTFLLVINFGYRDSLVVSIPNFTTLSACQARGKHIFTKLGLNGDFSGSRVNIYEYNPSK